MTGTKVVAAPASQPITRERIAAAAVELLDAGGEAGLTFRALAKRLDTGHGALQWHLPTKAALLQAAAAALLVDGVLVEGVLGDETSGSPRETIHSIALGVYDAIEAHPWLGAQLAKPPWRDTMLRIFEQLGRAVRALGAPERSQFTATSTLLIYIIGSGSQEAATSRSPAAQQGRATALEAISAHWAQLDTQEWSFTRSMAPHLRTHDDRAEFLAGVDLVLDGLVSPRRRGETT